MCAAANQNRWTVWLGVNGTAPLSRQRIWQFALLSVAAAVALAFLLPEDLFLSAPGADIGQFAAWRAFASDSVRAGHFPLWNPYTYAGQPFLGDFLSAELYPPNIIFLFLPVARAVNLSYFLHILILGWGVGVWTARRGSRPGAAALAGMVIALSGPVFLRFYSGHLGNLCSMAWVPWMFCALEVAWRGPAWRPVLLAAAAVALQILGGYPQYVFDAAVAAGLHAVVYSVIDPAVRRRELQVVGVVYVAGAALAAAQLLPGFAAAAESVRADKLDFRVVSQFSFPPENFLTLIAPGFFGNLTSAVYWGRCYLWEVCPFIGATGVVLAALALGDRTHRRWARADLVIVLGLLVLALGAHTPLLRVLYDYVPEFGKFRTQAKFIFPAVVLAMPLLAAGADAVMGGRYGAKWFAGAVMALGMAVGVAGIYLLVSPGQIAGALAFIRGKNESYLSAAQFADADFIRACGWQAGQSLAVAGALLAMAGAALWLAQGAADVALGAAGVAAAGDGGVCTREFGHVASGRSGAGAGGEVYCGASGRLPGAKSGKGEQRLFSGGAGFVGQRPDSVEALFRVYNFFARGRPGARRAVHGIQPTAARFCAGAV